MTWKKMRKIVTDTSDHQKEKQTTSTQNDGQDSYLAAVRRLFGGSDLAQQKAPGVVDFARQGTPNAQRIANTLTSGAMSSLKRGDVGSLDRDTIYRATLDNATLQEYLSGMGTFDKKEFATNPAYVMLPSSNYLKQLGEQFQMQRAGSIVQDDFARASKDRWFNTRDRWQDMFNRLSEMNENNEQYFWTYADWLLGDRSADYDIDKYNVQWDEMSDDDFFAEQDRLRKQFEELDWAKLTSIQSPEYTSQTPTYDAYLKTVNSELARRETIEELESLARSNPAYASLSVYNDTYEEPARNFFSGFADTPYVQGLDELGRFLNVRSTWAEKELAAEHSGAVSGYLAKGYDYLTDEELANYNVLYNMDQSKAAAYLDALSDDLLYRRAQAMKSVTEVKATNPWLAVPSWVEARLNTLGNIGALPLQAYQAAKGQDSPYSAAYDAVNQAGYVTKAQSDALGDIEGLEWSNLFGKNLAQHLYGGISGAADNAMRLAASGGNPAVAAGLAGAQAASGSLQESATRDNMSGTAKIVKALLTAGAEVGTEKIGLDALFDKGKTGAFNYIKGVIGAELGEETINYLSEDAIEAAVAFVFDHEADIKSAPEFWQGLGETALQTIISSGLMGAGGASNMAAGNYSAGKTVQTQGDAEAVLSIGESMNEDTQSYTIAKDIRAKMGKGGKVSTYQLGRLTRQLEADLGAEHSRITNQVMDDAIAARLMELGDDAQTAKKNAPMVRKVSRGQESTAFERASVKWNDNASQVVKELAREVKAEGDTQRTGMKWQTDRTIQEEAQTGEVQQKKAQLRDAVTTPKSSAVKEAETKAEQITKGRKSSGKNLTATKVSYATEGSAEKFGEFKHFVKDGGEIRMVIKTDDGEQTVAVSDMTDAVGKGTATIIEYTTEARNDMSAEEANALMKTYQVVGGDAGQVIEKFDQVYAAGYAGIDMPTVNLPDNVKQDIYAEARKDSAAAEETRAQRTKAARGSGKGGVTWLGKVTSNDQVTGTGSEEALTGAMEAMTESQRSTVEGVKAIAQAAKVNIVLFESDLAGEDKIQNGSYHEGTNTIYLDINSGTNDQEGASAAKRRGTLGYAMMRTLSHELTHYIEASSAEGYANLKAAMKQQLKERGLDWATLVRGKLDNAAAQHIRLTRAGAEAEVIADASEYMLENSAAIEKLGADLKNKIKGFVQDFLQRIRTALGKLVGGHAESKALRQQVDGVNRYVGQLQKLWDVALEETVEKADQSGDATEIVEEDNSEFLRQEGASSMEKSQQKIAEESKGLNSEATMDRVRSSKGQYSLRDSSGNEVSLSNEEVQANKTYVANMEPVAVLTGNPMSKDSGVDFFTAGTAYFQSIGGKAENQVLGTVSLNEKGIRHLINRKLTWRKTALLRAVKPVIEKGKILHVENDHNNKDTAVIGAVVQLDGQNYYMGVVVSQNDRMDNHYELHDAVIVQMQKKSADALTKTPSADKYQARRGIDNSSIAIILSDLANYNREFSFVDNEKTEPKPAGGIPSKKAQATYTSEKHNDLRVQTMYIGAKKRSLATPMDEQASINTPEASSGTASTNSVLQQGDKVNRKNQDQHSLRDAVEDVRFSIRDGSITTESTEEERYEVLKDAVLTLAAVDESNLQDIDLSAYNTRKKSDVEKGIRALAKMLGITNVDLTNSRIDFPFTFTNKNLGKSLHHQLDYGGTYQDYVKAMSCFDEIVENAIPIETHNDKKAGTKKADTSLRQVYVLLSAFQDSEGITPVQLEIKEFWNNANQLYLTVALTKITPRVVENGLAADGSSVHSLFPGVTAESEVVGNGLAVKNGSYHSLFSGTAADSEVVEAPAARNAGVTAPLFPESTISLRALIENVNSNDYKFFKYVPDGFLNEEQKAAKQRALAEQEREYKSYSQMSLRDGVEEPSVREYIGKLKPTERMSETESLLLARYQDSLSKLEEAEKGIAEQESIITEGATGDELIKARNRLEVYRKQSARYTRELVKAERAEGFAGIMATSYQVVNDYLRDYNADQVADAADRLDAEIRDLAGQLKDIGGNVSRTAQGQHNAFARGLFNQADLNAAAKKLRDSYGARMTVKEIADRLALAYGEIYAADGAEGAKRFTEAAKDLAQDILNRSRYRYKSDVLTTLAQEIGTISLTETDLQEIRNAGLTLTEYKRALSPYIKVTEGASDLSSYLSNDAYYGGVLTAIVGEDTEGNLAMGLYEVINREKGLEQAGSFEGMSESESLGAVIVDVMSANLPLSANDKTLEYLRKELLKYAGENAQAAAAVDKAISSARSVTDRASAVWRRAVQEQSLGRQAVEYYRALDEQRRVLELQEQKKAITEQLRSEAAKEITRQVEEKRAEYKAREAKAREYRSVRDDVLKLRKAISRSVKYLNTRRARETDQRHIPHELTKLVDYVLAEFTDEKLVRLSFSAGQAARLNSLYNKLKEIDADDTYFWDDEVEEKLRYITDLADTYHDLMYYENGQRRAPSLESYEHEREILTELEDVIENVRRMVDAENEIFLEEKDETFREFSADTAKALLDRKDVHLLRGGAGDIQKAVNELLWTGNMTPVYFFERLQNEGLMAVFNAVRDGQRAYGRILNEAKQFLQDSKERHHYDRWVGDGMLTFKTVQGHEITLTREQALWAYATAKREASMELKKTEHLSKGGFHFRNTGDDAGAKGLYRNTDKAHQLKDADIQTINNWLTAEQKAYADELVEYLSTTMGDYGNQASLAMYGYKKFREKYYFPFRTWSAQRFQRGDEGSDNTGEASRIMSAGFTKNLTHKANTALEMSDFTDVIGDHIQAMTTYATMVTPVENIKRLMNHKVTDTDNTISTIRALIGQKYGVASQTYVTDFLRDLNGAVQTDNRATGLVDKMVGAFKRGAVAGSLSVVVQQPTAIFRAMAFIAPKYFRMNSDTKNDGKLWEEMLRHSGAAVVKDAGKFDVGLGHSAAEWVTGQDVMAPWEVYRRLKAQSKTKAGKEAFDSLKEWLTFLPGWADQITWQAMWKAVKNEQHALHPEMDTSSEEFLDLCGKRFDDVMDHTQVYDSVLVKSNLMRSKNQLHKMATSFMSEPTLTLNIMIDALKGKHGKKQGAKMFTAAVVSQIAAGVLAALIQAWNDDDDERNAKEKYLDRALYNIVGNLNPLEMIPYVSNLWDTIEGFTVQRSDMEVINDLVTYSKQVSNGNLTGWSAVEKLGGAIANIFGVPLGNIMRDIRRVDNAVKSDRGKADSENLGFIAQENLNPFWQDSKKAYYNRMVSAALKGDTGYYDDLMEYMLTSKMTSESAIKTGMRNILKEMVQSGEMTPDEATDFLNQYASYANTKDNTKKPLEWAAE